MKENAISFIQAIIDNMPDNAAVKFGGGADTVFVEVYNSTYSVTNPLLFAEPRLQLVTTGNGGHFRELFYPFMRDLYNGELESFPVCVVDTESGTIYKDTVEKVSW